MDPRRQLLAQIAALRSRVSPEIVFWPNRPRGYMGQKPKSLKTRPRACSEKPWQVVRPCKAILAEAWTSLEPARELALASALMASQAFDAPAGDRRRQARVILHRVVNLRRRRAQPAGEEDDRHLHPGHPRPIANAGRGRCRRRRRNQPAGRPVVAAGAAPGRRSDLGPPSVRRHERCRGTRRWLWSLIAASPHWRATSMPPASQLGGNVAAVRPVEFIGETLTISRGPTPKARWRPLDAPAAAQRNAQPRGVKSHL